MTLELNSQGLADSAKDKRGNHPFISIIMPAFNEEKAIGKVISEIAILMKSNHLPYEIIVVDDCSFDKTASEARKLGAIVLHNEVNRGKGYCLRKALSIAKGDLILTMDSDGEHRPPDIINLLKPAFQGVDVVAGSRFIFGSKKITCKAHIIGNHLFNLCIMLLTGRRITDSQTGFRVFKRHVIDSLRLESNGYEIESEITMKSLRNGFSFFEVPIKIKRREHGLTRIKLLYDGAKILKTIFLSSLTDQIH